MKSQSLFIFSFIFLSLSACIQDDFVNDMVDPVVRILSDIESIEINTTFQLEHMYLNNIGKEESADVAWSSSDPDIISVSATGLISALNFGSATVGAEVQIGDELISDFIQINVGNSTTVNETSSGIEGTIQTTSSYVLTGDFVYTEEDGGVVLEFNDNYRASTALPGLYIYLSNNKNSIANALEVGSVEVFNGAHSYRVDDVRINDFSHIVYFCKPFNVKVGDGELQ